MIIKLTRPADLQALYLRAVKDAQAHNITWEGDMHQGQGAHRGFEARYEVTADEIIIAIIKKPLLISHARIRQEVQAYITT